MVRERSGGSAPPSVDVVVVTYRSEATITACLASVMGSAPASVVVVENASGDEAANLAEAAGATVVRNDDNVGFARAANQGARRGRSEFVLFLNPDAVLTDGAWDAMLAAAVDESVAVVGADLVHPDGTAQRSRWPFPSPGGMWIEALGFDRLRSLDPRESFVVGACFLVRRRCFEALGGFDEAYWLYGE
jgi:GT2 family glycosyltransferase